MKTCSKCRLKKDYSEFTTNKSRRDGYDNNCRDCKAEYQKRWYERNKARHVKNVRARNKLVEKECQHYVLEHLLANPCACGEARPAALQFHHVRGEKSGEVSTFFAYSLGRVKEEIEKCDVMCANCHAVLTANERGYYTSEKSLCLRSIVGDAPGF